MGKIYVICCLLVAHIESFIGPSFPFFEVEITYFKLLSAQHKFSTILCYITSSVNGEIHNSTPLGV